MDYSKANGRIFTKLNGREEAMTYVLSLGGSIVAPPHGPDLEINQRLRARQPTRLDPHPTPRNNIVVGGGGPARTYQNALREFWRLRGEGPSGGAAKDADLDWLGIAATKINAQFVKAAMGELCEDEVVTDPSGPIVFTGKVLVASGWKPGFSAITTPCSWLSASTPQLCSISPISPRSTPPIPSSTPQPDLSTRYPGRSSAAWWDRYGSPEPISPSIP
jgi:uridylate kinase